MGNPVTYFEIAGKDSEELNDFYCSVFEWKTQVNPQGGNYFILDLMEATQSQLLDTLDSYIDGE